MYNKTKPRECREQSKCVISVVAYTGRLHYNIVFKTDAKEWYFFLKKDQMFERWAQYWRHVNLSGHCSEQLPFFLYQSSDIEYWLQSIVQSQWMDR